MAAAIEFVEQSAVRFVRPMTRASERAERWLGLAAASSANPPRAVATASSAAALILVDIDVSDPACRATASPPSHVPTRSAACSTIEAPRAHA